MENDEGQAPEQQPAQEQPEQSQPQESPQASEKDVLIAEKQRLAEEIGIWGSFNPIPDYQESPQFKRIEVIDQRLADFG